MNGNVNEFIMNSVEIAIKNSNYFMDEGIGDFEIVAMDYIDDSYNVIEELKGEKPVFKMLVLVKHKQTVHGNNYTAFTVVTNPYYWTMDAMYDGGATIYDGEIWGHDIFFGALTKEMATSWIVKSLGVKEVA